MRTPWRKEDDEFLISHYQTGKREFIQARFPLKTWGAIKARAQKLSLDRSCFILSEWTSEEEELLHDIYPTAKWEELLSAFPRRRKSNIHEKASHMGIRRPKPKILPKKGIYQNCKHCGKSVYRPPSRQDRLFCSPACGGAFVTAERDAAFFNRSHSRQYSPRFNEKFKRMIRERDGHRCALCGRFAKHVHHINYQKLDTRPDNCIVLCQHCNIKVNFDMAHWQQQLIMILKKRIIPS